MDKMVLGVCILLLGMNAGCGPDEKTATRIQDLGAGCTLHRPVTWTVSGTTCVENPNATDTPMDDGQSIQIFADVYGVFGDGSVTYRCDNGAIVQVSATCHQATGDPR
jgi:hypothetical protein